MVVRSFCDTWSSKALERYDSMTMAWPDVCKPLFPDWFQTLFTRMIDAEKWLQKWLSYVAVIFHNLFHLCLEVKLTTLHRLWFPRLKRTWETPPHFIKAPHQPTCDLHKPAKCRPRSRWRPQYASGESSWLHQSADIVLDYPWLSLTSCFLE